MNHSTQETLRFPPVDGLTVRGAFDGGALSSDFGPLRRRGIDRQIGLTERLAQAFRDTRHPSYISHSVRALFAQRPYQIACAYEDGNDANALRTDPMFKLGLERRPLDETRAEAEASIREYIEIFYHRQRRHSRLGNVAPVVFAQNFRKQQQAA